LDLICIFCGTFGKIDGEISATSSKLLIVPIYIEKGY
jgi:hypothetical protein